jgi:hypothetical protein
VSGNNSSEEALLGDLNQEQIEQNHQHQCDEERRW